MSRKSSTYLAFVTVLILSACTLEPGQEIQSVPDPQRFVKVPLSVGEFTEPMEMAILPNLDILIAQRRGEILYFDQAKQQLYRAGLLDAYYKSSIEGLGVEEGVLGIALDPDFDSNQFIYIFYSLANQPMNRLSRFVLRDRSIDMNSEKVILEFFSKRDMCCHTGGSLAFGSNRTLYLSTGDNTAAHDPQGAEHLMSGSAPINDQPGMSPYDARRSSANTNDLRGKILRIRILPDGSYEIPPGNLFPGSELTRPEIYIMGLRNPFRISVDPLNNDVYWGDIGPDAALDMPNRGPQGYDEFNRASEAGNFGWPLFSANNIPYYDFDFSSGESGHAFDASAPVNDSVYNTGLKTLPPAQPAFLWYPYAKSETFPELGSGSRSAMVGPIYRKQFYPKTTRLIDYFDGKVLLFDWMRNNFFLAKVGENNALISLDPAFENLGFHGPIDAELGPDGRLYILEYGSGWSQHNTDSQLSRIEYIEGNLAPTITDLQVSQFSGALPFNVDARAFANDFDSQKLTYTWRINGEVYEENSSAFTATLNKPGLYELQFSVSDSMGAISHSKVTTLYAGNDRPKVNVRLEGNQSFYFPERPIALSDTADSGLSARPIAYKVNVEDDKEIIEENVSVSVSLQMYPPKLRSNDEDLRRQALGEERVNNAGCRTCHQDEKDSQGPAFTKIAERYSGDPDFDSELVTRIVGGTVGAWGQTPMPAHPEISEADVSNIVRWIRSLNSVEAATPSLPINGEIDPLAGFFHPFNQSFVLRADYIDAPEGDLKPLGDSGFVTLEPSTIYRYWFDGFQGFDIAGHFLRFSSEEAHFKVVAKDLLGIDAFKILTTGQAGQKVNINHRLGSLDGDIVASGDYELGKEIRVQIDSPSKRTSHQDIFVIFSLSQSPSDDSLFISMELVPSDV